MERKGSVYQRIGDFLMSIIRRKVDFDNSWFSDYLFILTYCLFFFTIVNSKKFIGIRFNSAFHLYLACFRPFPEMTTLKLVMYELQIKKTAIISNGKKVPWYETIKDSLNQLGSLKNIVFCNSKNIPCVQLFIKSCF